MKNNKSNPLKKLVRNKYNAIASLPGADQEANCCEPTGCCAPANKNSSQNDVIFSVMAESYDGLDGYQPEADLHLGCGIPIEYAGLKPGQSVLDLGSGAGNDLFVARSIVGSTGRLFGLDFSEKMIQKARLNAQKPGYGNMEFISGDIEDMPFDDNQFDVVLSNCVLNLVPDKHRAFSEIHRVLKRGGNFSISDIVLEGNVPEPIQNAAEAYVGCVSGATQKTDYLEIVRKTGFSAITIQKEREIIIPPNWFAQVLGEQDVCRLKSSDTFRVLSITLTGVKAQ